MKADRRLYLNADRSRVVEDGDPEAAYLLAAEGTDISNEDVRRYGLDKKQAPEPEPMVVHSIAADPPKDEPKEDAPAEDDDDKAESKAVSGPPANKAQSRKAAEDK
jgi:hypothetical protein